MKEMQIFENQEFGAVRTVELDGEPWLVGKDVAQALGYSDTDQALRKHVDEEDKKILTRQNDGFLFFAAPSKFLIWQTVPMPQSVFRTYQGTV